MCTYVCGPQSVDVRDVQVEATYPELAELLLVVIKTLLSRDPQFTVSQGVCVCVCVCIFDTPELMLFLRAQ